MGHLIRAASLAVCRTGGEPRRELCPELPERREVPAGQAAAVDEPALQTDRFAARGDHRREHCSPVGSAE